MTIQLLTQEDVHQLQSAVERLCHLIEEFNASVKAMQPSTIRRQLTGYNDLIEEQQNEIAKLRRKVMLYENANKHKDKANS